MYFYLAYFDMHSTKRSIISLVLVLWTSLTIAQSSTNSTGLDSCPTGDNPYVNSSGSTAFETHTSSESPIWYLSVTHRNSGDKGGRDPWFNAYISVPDNSTSQACAYIFNAPSRASSVSDNGCDGVISQECANYFAGSLHLSTQSTEGDRVKCPSILSFVDVREACGDAILDIGVVNTGEN